MTKLIDIVKKNPSNLDKIHLFAGVCIWQQNALETELDSGIWIPVGTFPDHIMNLNMPIDSEEISSLADEFDDEIPDEGKENQKEIDEDQFDLWKAILQNLGSSYKDFSNLPSKKHDIESIEWN